MSNDSAIVSQITKRFTVIEANAMLPLVKSIASDISQAFRVVTRRRADLHRLLRKGARTAGQLYDDEMAESRSDLQEEYDRIWQYREELETLGIFLRQPEEGVIEFPTTIDEQDAFLSWQLGEDTIQFYRRADEPHNTRREVSSLESA